MIGSFFNSIGARTTQVITYPVELTTLFSACIRSTVAASGTGQLNMPALIQRQVYFTAVQAVPLVTVTSLSIGALIFVAAISLFPGWGIASLVGPAVIFLLTRELGPIFLALIVIARSGTAIATELGNMKINREVDLLESHGIDILYFLIFPRIVGMVIGMIILDLIFAFFSVMGGYTFSRSLADASEFPLYKFLDALEVSYISTSIIKTILFALVISTICCYHGLEPSRSSTEVPQCATKAVVYSLALCVLVNSFLSIYL